MFEHFGVNSLSAFRHKFRHYQLRPHGSGSGAAAKGSTSAAEGPAPLLGGPGSGNSRNRWQVQQREGGTYVGELLDGRPHGGGILLSKAGGGWVLHMGRWSEGKRNGPGVVVTSRGEEMQGFFLDDTVWGPAEYRFVPMPGGSSSAHGSSSDAGSSNSDGQPPHRLAYAGMMNGRPQGRGCMTWSDGTREMGQFDGTNCYLRMSQDEVAGVLLVAADNASEARIAAAEVQHSALRQHRHIAEEAAQIFAMLSPPQAPAAHADAA
ncbi:F-box domain [Chlorella sorokiniana]|uniref:F-box domain n=1 Tax=Chlorella sorokiniana TaxID=3076 RepID=A0A2P6TZB6_CHLSO|nr:F-box domain [Chlorella sorokiniana]|eukprot:PRW59380.1 F-box domain [Chlorella sorokiniana]